MIEQSTAIDDAILALVEVLQAAMPDTQVLDGPDTVHLEKDTIVVGVDDTAAVIQRGEPDYGGRVTEVADIVCVVSCWDGETSVAKKRRRARDLLSTIDTTLRANPRLTCPTYPDGAVDDAYLGPDMQMLQRQQKGALVAIGFSVRYEAHI